VEVEMVGLTGLTRTLLPDCGASSRTWVLGEPRPPESG
jgi:hypothetical protein